MASSSASCAFGSVSSTFGAQSSLGKRVAGFRPASVQLRAGVPCFVERYVCSRRPPSNVACLAVSVGNPRPQWTALPLEIDSVRRSCASPVLLERLSLSRFVGGSVVYRKAGRGSPGIVLAAAAPPTGTEELPLKLQEIVKLFQQVADPRAKYEQLLYYAKQLKPLASDFCTKENKVEGCVSQVWVRPTLNVEESTVSFEANSDSLLTKGLAALLVEGLSGATVKEVLKVNPEFIQMLGLNQSLTPSRSNGFLNMLKLMQKKTLQMYMEAEASKSSQC